MVERFAVNEDVGGPSPPGGAEFSKIKPITLTNTSFEARMRNGKFTFGNISFAWTYKSKGNSFKTKTS